jgi:hypothetical protein
VQDSVSTPRSHAFEGMKDEDRVEFYDPSLVHELEPQLDGLDENSHFTPPIKFYILHNTCNNNKYLAP